MGDNIIMARKIKVKQKQDTNKNKLKKNKSSKKRVLLILLAIVLLVAIGVTLYMASLAPKKYETVSQSGETLSNDLIEITFLEAGTISELVGYEFDENYVYVALMYQTTNISEETITWEDYPYVSIMQYEMIGTTYEQVKDSEAEYDFNALQAYSINHGIDYTMILEDMDPGETRIDADIIMIPANDFDTERFFITIDSIDTLVQINDNRVSDEE